jgi:hypothetical protein
VKGHAGIPGNERADLQAGKAAEQRAWSQDASLVYLKLKASTIKIRLQDPGHHGAGEIPPPPPKKSCLDWHEMSLLASPLKSGQTVEGWPSCSKESGSAGMITAGSVGLSMTRSHTLPHCSNAKQVEPRQEAWELEDESPGCLEVLLSSPR